MNRDSSCYSARKFDPTESRDIKGLACRSASNPHAEQHRGGLPRRYPGGTENDSILRTVLRSSPNTREASRVFIPSTRHARRTRAYISTRYIPPPSSQSNPDRRLYAVPFWSATAGSTGRFSGGLLRRRSQSACHCIGSLARSGEISIVTTAPMVEYKIHWLKMMSVPESRVVVGRHEGINGRDK